MDPGHVQQQQLDRMRAQARRGARAGCRGHDPNAGAGSGTFQTFPFPPGFSEGLKSGIEGCSSGHTYVCACGPSSVRWSIVFGRFDPFRQEKQRSNEPNSSLHVLLFPFRASPPGLLFLCAFLPGSHPLFCLQNTMQYTQANPTPSFHRSMHTMQMQFSAMQLACRSSPVPQCKPSDPRPLVPNEPGPFRPWRPRRQSP